MTAQHIMLQLLRLDPLCMREIVNITGWPTKRVRSTLAGLRASKKINHTGVYDGYYWV